MQLRILCYIFVQYMIYEVYNTGRDTSSAGHGILLQNNVEYTTVECNNIYNIGSNNGHSLAIAEYAGIDPKYIIARYNLFVDQVYIHSGVDDTSTFEISNNQYYDGNNPPPFDPYCNDQERR